ncbi:zinc finger protein 761-like [Oppia nitens]|uniref:zinc finger protein 761-like n=1 Tax=Oppia nitens TaxID=1686743 RepID=UPI0023DACC4D|nr:zinc finger protein 761-like [Oppia nitens]
MMATNIVMIKDVLDELNEENQRLLRELRYCQQLREMFDKYRHLVNSLQTNCVCIENIGLKTKFNELEDQYMKTLKRPMKLKTMASDCLVTNSDENIVFEESVDNFNNDYFNKTVDTVDDSLTNKSIKRSRGRPKKLAEKMVYKCHYMGCDKQFGYKSLLQTHIRIKHVMDEQQQQQQDDDDNTCYEGNSANDSDGTEIISETNCSDSWSESKQKAKKIQQKTTPKTKRRIRRKKWLCDWDGCDRQFRHPCELLTHKRIRHTGDRPFKCPKCQKSFPVNFQLINHQKLYHSNRLFQCRYDNCDKVYRFSRSLDDHHRRHEGLYTKTFKCDVGGDDNDGGCDKSFYNNYLLKVHKRTAHSDDRPYRCDWPGCDQRFKRQHCLFMHRKTHTNVRNYRCDIEGCDKLFTSSSRLNGHKQFHIRPHQCSWPGCEARFGEKIKLQFHLNGHQGLKPYKCHFPDCDVSYSGRTSLESHLKHKHNFMKSYHRDY